MTVREMNKGKVIPEIRLDNFNEIWMERKFSNIVNKVSKQSNDSNIPKVEFQDIISGEGRLNKDVSNKFDDRKGTIFQPGFILYGKLRPYLNNWLYPEFEGVALGDFWVFESVDSCSIFNYYLIQSERYQTVANISSGTKMPRSDWKTVAETVFLIPNRYEEQQKIGAFFKQLDDIITLQQQLLDDHKQLKKAMLQKMFPQKGKSVPRIRFAGFSDVWKEKKLDEMGAFLRGNNISKNDLINKGKQKCVLYGELFTIYKEVIYSVVSYTDKDIENPTIAYENDILFPTSTTADALSLINPSSMKDDNVLIGGDISLFRPKENIIDSSFLSYAINGPLRNEISKYAVGTTIIHIYSSELKKVNLYIPSLSEQEKIGNFFKHLDETIEFYEKKIRTYQELKKAMLQKMFV